jgi:hypothetical protein
VAAAAAGSNAGDNDGRREQDQHAPARGTGRDAALLVEDSIDPLTKCAAAGDACGLPGDPPPMPASRVGHLHQQFGVAGTFTRLPHDFVVARLLSRGRNAAF